MQNQPEQLQTSQHADQYKIMLPLEEGGQGSVYIGSKNNVPFALKVYFPDSTKAFEKETTILQNLNFPNIINMIDCRPEATIKVNSQPEQIKRPLLVLQLAEIDLCAFFQSGLGSFSPDICRTYAKQLIAAVKYLDSKGVTHRDIKPENILFDEHFILKLSDFGLARDSKGNQGNYKLSSRVGSSGYQPPEMEHHNYSGLKADMFAIGVIIFVLFKGGPPFMGTMPGQKRYELYKLIKKGKLEKFWSLHQKVEIPLSFKRLMNCFFCPDPEKRPSFEELEEDQWLKGDTVMNNQLEKYMKQKMDLLRQKKKKLRDIAQLKRKLYLERVRIQQQGSEDTRGIDDHSSPAYNFAINYVNFDLIKTQDLPCYRKKKAIYVKENVAFITAWLKDHLNSLFEQQQIFMTYTAEEISPIAFKLTLNDEKKQLNTILQFMVDGEKTELALLGKLHRSQKDNVGIDWVRVDGPDFWLSSIESRLNESLQAIA